MDEFSIMGAMTNNVRGTQKKRKHIQSKHIAQREGHESLNAVFDLLYCSQAAICWTQKVSCEIFRNNDAQGTILLN